MIEIGTLDRTELVTLLERFGLGLTLLARDAPIPGSYWGAPEAGLAADVLYARLDTPLHSVLHEAGHYVCMTSERRAGLDTDAGGDDLEECGVCYLQVLLADELAGVGREALFADMDAWGYNFRLGSAREWFGSDAEDARGWLRRHGVIDAFDRPTGRLR